MSRRLLLAAAGILALSGGYRLLADDVVLVPGTISGSISAGGVNMRQATVYAAPSSGGSPSSITVSPNAPAANYSLTVNVPQAGNATFNGYAIIYSDDFRDYLQTSSSPVTVSNVTPGTLNITPAVGFINAAISVSGGTLARAFIAASQSGAYAQTSADVPDGWTFPAMPGSTTVYGTAYLADGRQINLPSQTVSVPSGQTVNVSFSVTAPNHAIGGTIDFIGPRTATMIYAYASGASSRTIQQSPQPADHAYLLDGLAAGNYNIGVYGYVSGNSYLFFPDSAFSPSRSVTVGSSQVTVNASVHQAFANTILSLTGAPTVAPFLSSGQVQYQGLPNTAAASAFSYNGSIALAARTFDSVLSPGGWRPGYLVLGFNRNATATVPSLSATLQFNDNRPGSQFTLAAGETRTYPVDLALGEITINMSVAGGGLLSTPRIQNANCTNVVNGTNLWTFYPNASSGQSNVTQGQVTFIGPAGTCTLTPTMTVNGSNVALSPITVTIVPGTTQVIDVGGPALTMTSPAADAIVATSSVTVSGRVTDDVGVATVTVNGVSVGLTTTGSAADPRERQFSTTVSGLQLGPNTIATVATDGSGKNGTDTRTVYYDTAPPTLTFTPADGTTTQASSITVTGTADDDAGVSRITVNGSPVSFSSTNNAAKPKEVSFTASVPLVGGSNAISVTVTDISTGTTSRTHTVTRQIQQPTALATSPVSTTFGGSASVSAVLTTASAPFGAAGGRTVKFTISVPGQNFAASVTGVTNALGSAAVSIPIAGLTPGTYADAVVVSFAGDSEYLASATSTSLTIGRRDQFISFASITDKTLGDPAFPISASADSNLAVSLAVISGSATLNGNSVTVTGGGPVTIRAAQGGDAFFNPAASVERTFNVAVPDLDVTSITLETRRWNGHTPIDSADAVATYQALPLGVPGYAPAPKTLTIFKNVSNQLTFGGVNNNVGYHHHFAFNAPLDGTLSIRIGADFGAGGTLLIDGVLVDFRNTNMWWNGSYANPTQILSGTVNISAGPHTIDSYGFENGNDGPQEAQYSYLGAPFKIFTAPANDVPAVTIAGAAAVSPGSISSYTFAVSDPDPGATFMLVSASCGANGTIVDPPVITPSGGSFGCAFPTGPAASTVSVQVKDNRGAHSNTATRVVSITKLLQTITFPPLLGATYGGADIPLGATASSNLPVSYAASGNCTIVIAAAHLTGAGSCTITASQAGNASYAAAADVAHTFAIAKASALIVVKGFDGIYDGNAHGATGTATGVAEEDLSNLLSLGDSFTNVPGGTATWTFTGNTNYNSATGTAAIVITKADATVTVAGHTGTYDGNPHGASGSATGLDGEALSGLDLGTSFTNAPGGTAEWTFTHANYASESGTVEIVINKADATIEVAGYTGIYDGNSHGATGTATGVATENLSNLLSLGDSFTNVPGGTATWTFTGNTNYNSATGTAAIIITKATAGLAWDAPVSIVYGTALAGAQLNASAAVGGTFVYAPASGTVLHAGAGQPLSVSFTPADANNYESASRSVAIEVTKAPLTVAAHDASKLYGAPVPPLSVGYTGFVNGDTQASLDVPASVATVATAASSAGSYAITASGASDGDYTFDYVPGALTIGRAPLTITADDKTMVINGSVPLLTATYGGFVNGDSSASLDTAVSLTTAATGNAPGAFPITASGGADVNYDVTHVAGTLTVTYDVCADEGVKSPAKSGSTIPVKLTLCGARGENLSTPGVTVTAFQIAPIGATPQDSGNANPDNVFRLTGDHYHYNLQTTGLASGAYQLQVRVTGDPVAKLVPFTIR